MASGALGLLLVFLCVGSGISIFALIAVALLTTIACALNRCPVCGKPVGRNPVRMLGGKMGWTLSIPDRCSKCHHPFPAAETRSKKNRAPRA